MKILVTGAFGNLGQETVAVLIRQGHEVTCFDRPVRANRRAAKRLRKQARIIWGDIRALSDLREAVAGQDAVVHLSFIIPPKSEIRPDLTKEINVGGTTNLLAVLKELTPSPKLVFASTVAAFGPTQDQPTPRTSLDPVRATDHYTLHKIECEELIRRSGLVWSILRLAAAPPARLTAMDPLFFEIPLDNRLEYLHPRDAGLALANAATRAEVNGRVLLIGGGRTCQVYQADFVRRLCKSLGLKEMPVGAFGHSPYVVDWLDTSESQSLLDYQHHSLDDYLLDLRRQLGLLLIPLRLFRHTALGWVLNHSPYLSGRKAAQKHLSPGQIALITGASSGIGEATARRLAAAGLRVCLTARRTDRLQKLAGEIREAGGEAMVVAADLTKEGECRRLYEQITAVWGPVDVLVNNAGFGWYGYASEMPWSLAREMIAVNITALVHLSLLCLPSMRSRNTGHIINISSIGGSIASQGIALYGATKAMVDYFTITLYRETRGSKVHVSLVRPGAVSSEFFSLAATREAGRPVPTERLSVAPSKVAARILRLLRHPRRTAHIPRFLKLVSPIELFFGWIIDRLGPMLLRRPAKALREARV